MIRRDGLLSSSAGTAVRELYDASTSCKAATVQSGSEVILLWATEKTCREDRLQTDSGTAPSRLQLSAANRFKFGLRLEGNAQLRGAKDKISLCRASMVSSGGTGPEMKVLPRSSSASLTNSVSSYQGHLD